MRKLFPFLFVFACLFFTFGDARADMCVALTKESKGYADKISTLRRVASVSYSTSEQAKLKEQIDQIRDMCSYKIFIELLKKTRNWEPYVFTSALAAKNTDAQDSFLELITKHAGKWQSATYRCASQIDSKEKAKLFKQMIAQAARVDFPAIAYDVLADINNEVQIDAFKLILQKKSYSNWQDAVFEAVKSLKTTEPSTNYPFRPRPNYPFMAFQWLLDKGQYKDWPAESYSELAKLTTEDRYNLFLLKQQGKKPEIALADPYKSFFNDKGDDPFKTFFDNESLETLIKINRIGSIEELLPKLPESLRSNYTLMFYSRSNQEASFQKPRAIMYTPLGDFLATFNDHSMGGGNILETISFNKKTFEFEFREVVFKNGKAHFSAINPPKCAACHHGSDLKPNWDDYPFWLGAYGMDDDQINSKIFSKAVSRSSKFVTPQDIKDAEAMLKKIGGRLALENTFEEFKKFRETKDKHPRYRHLVDWYLKYAPYREMGEEPSSDAKDVVSLGTPNELLNEYIGVWNIQRIFHKVKNTPGYKKERMNLLHFLAGCGTVPQKNRSGKSSPQEIRGGLIKRFLDTGGLPNSDYSELFTKKLGVDYLKMTDLTFGRDVMAFNDIVDSDYRMAYLLAKDLKKSVPAIEKHIKIDPGLRDARSRRMNSIAPKLLFDERNHIGSYLRWEGCAALKEAMATAQ